MSLEGAVVHVSLHPGLSPSNCIVSFAVGPPMLVEFSSGSIKQLPAFIMGTSRLYTACQQFITPMHYSHMCWVGCCADGSAPNVSLFQVTVGFGVCVGCIMIAVCLAFVDHR